MNPGLLLGLWQFVLEISARFLRICDPAAEGGQVVFIPSLGLEIRRQIALGHLVGDAMERGGYMTPLLDSCHG